MAARKLVSSESEFESEVGYSRAVRVGHHIAVAGTTGAGPAGDIAAQTRDALRRIEIAPRRSQARRSRALRVAAKHANWRAPRSPMWSAPAST